MININNIFRLLLLVSVTTISFQSNAAPQPVWEAMRPAVDSQDNTKPTEIDNGFAKPPPSSPAPEKLSALIITDNTEVKKGEPITFTLESNQSDIRYYWLVSGQKSTSSSFTVNTSPLEVGKHRVRVSITNKQRVQAHASLFFHVVESGSNSENDQSENESNTDESVDSDGKIIELPAANVDQPQPSAGTEATPANDTGNANTNEVVELPAVNPDAGDDTKAENQDVEVNDSGTDSANENTKSGTEDSSSDSLTVSMIVPKHQRVVTGSSATFRSGVSASDGYSFKWKFAGQRSDSEEFEISSGSLATGSYLVHLTTTDKDNVETKSQATLVISSTEDNSITVITIPDVVGTDFSALKSQLEEKGLQLGKVSEQPVKEGVGTVIEQTPKAGGQLDKGAVVDVVVGISSTVSTPSLLGQKISAAKQQLTTSGLKSGEVTEQVDDNGIGIVIGQNPKSGTEMKRGASVNLIVGKATPKSLTVNIQPASTVVEQGKVVELSSVIVDPEVDKNLSFSWKLGELSSQDRNFVVDTKTLSPGKYSVELEIKNTEGQQVTQSATFQVTPKSIEVPDLIGKELSDIDSILKQVGLTLGEVQQRPSDENEKQVLEQSPSTGEFLTKGGIVNLVVASAKQEKITTLILSVDKDKIKVGESVTFTSKLVPEAKGNGLHYVYTMNAEKKANVRPAFEWTPSNEGIYSVIVTAFNDAGILAKSEALSIDVSAAWELPVAKMLPEMQVSSQGEKAEFVSTSTYDLNSSLNYDWSSETGHSGSKKQFVFDTSDIEPGSYTITLNVADDQGNKTSSTAMLVVQASVGSVNGTGVGIIKGSDKTEGKATSPAKEPNIQLSVTRQFVSTNTPIKIKVNSDQSLTSEQYYFEPGDDENTQWLSSNEIEHSYKGFGTYLARAAVKQGDKIYYSDNVTVWVWSPMLLLLTAGIGLLAYILMWWWTKVPKSKRKNNNKDKSVVAEAIKPAVIEEQVPLSTDASDENDIVTDARLTEERTVGSVLKRAIFQFILGIGISILVLYVILKSANLI
ncbi:MAG: PASTA domain-containing protein [Thiotrichaceae bacterium]